ncbi:MAG: hypothetical protein HY006_04490 [Candidatus Sungbacteria bacterium]|nr:hypothetical protein [Candidatus Sungbacteria bacterium]
MKFFLKGRNLSHGFTILESVVALGIMGMVVGALAMVFGRGVGANRHNYEQILITEEARTQLIHISDSVRNASLGASSGEWLLAAGENSLTINTNADGDADIEQVAYALTGTELAITVTQPDATFETRTLTRYARNLAGSVSLFTYYNTKGEVLAATDATSINVNRIGLVLLIDVNPNQAPDTVTVTTSAFPRGAVQAVGGAGSRLWATAINYPVDPATNAYARVTTTDSGGGGGSTIAWPITHINTRLSTYVQGYKVNINYQADQQGSFVPGWYAWIGPIFVGQSGTQKYYVTDQVPLADLCVGASFNEILATCAARTVSAGSFSVTYRPIIMYDFGGYQDYVGEFAATYAIPTPTPTPSPTPTPDPTPTPTPAPPALLVHWKLDENNSNTAYDSSGNGRDATLNNGLGNANSWLEAEDGIPSLSFGNVAALEFDGSNDNMTFGLLQGAGYHTYAFAAWIKTTNNGTQVLPLGNPYGNDPNDNFYTNAILIDGGRLKIRNGGTVGCPSVSTINDGQWHHIVVSVSNIVTYYFDGIHASTSCSIPVAGGSASVSSIFVNSEAYLFGMDYNSTNYFEGSIDDIRFYNGELSEEQAQTLAAGNEL